jgi:hypothetical protein
MDNHTTPNKAVGEAGQGTLDDFGGDAGAPGDIGDDVVQGPGAVEMGGGKPVGAPDEADLMAGRPVKKQTPAFPARLNVIRQAVWHGLIYPANAVDAELFDDNLFNDLRLFRGLVFFFSNFGCFFIHSVPVFLSVFLEFIRRLYIFYNECEFHASDTFKFLSFHTSPSGEMFQSIPLAPFL